LSQGNVGSETGGGCHALWVGGGSDTRVNTDNGKDKGREVSRSEGGGGLTEDDFTWKLQHESVSQVVERHRKTVDLQTSSGECEGAGVTLLGGGGAAERARENGIWLPKLSRDSSWSGHCVYSGIDVEETRASDSLQHEIMRLEKTRTRILEGLAHEMTSTGVRIEGPK
jgi:hypothetical protein